MINYFIAGIDGFSYVIDEGKLVKVINVFYSEHYFTHTDGYALYTLENGKTLKIGDGNK